MANTFAYLGIAGILTGGFAIGQRLDFQKSTEKVLPITQAACFATANEAFRTTGYPNAAISGNDVKGDKYKAAFATITCAPVSANQTKVTVSIMGSSGSASGLTGDHYLLSRKMGLDPAEPAGPDHNAVPATPGFQQSGSNVQLDGPTLSNSNMATAAMCQAACRQDPNCQAFSYIRPEARPERVGQCSLLKAPFISRQNTCCESGLRTGVSVGFNHQPGLTSGRKQEFRNPTSGGLFVDQCWVKGGLCGQAAADNYCFNIGWLLASTYQTSPGNASTFRTGDRTLCHGSCPYFTTITCER